MNVLATWRIPDIGIRLLEEQFNVTVYQGNAPLNGSSLVQQLEGMDGVLAIFHNRFTREIIEQLTTVKVIANMAVGYDNIDVAAATEKGICVTNTPGVLTEATADLAWALLLAVTRRVVEGDQVMRQDRFEGWDPLYMLGAELYGKTIGIVGMGRIGTAVARRSKGWDMTILFTSRTPKPEVETALGARRVDFTTLLQEADIISVHTPLTEETYHLFDRKAFQTMKKTAYLINTARGPVVDEEALVEALKSGEIAGAGLDVFEREPLAHPGLKALPNVVMTPHIGSATHETRNRMAEMAARNLIDCLQGKRPAALVNPEVWNKTN